MADEVLYVPERLLPEVIEVFRAGLAARPETTKEVRDGLESWCDEKQEYLEQMATE